MHDSVSENYTTLIPYIAGDRARGIPAPALPIDDRADAVYEGDD